MIGDYGSGIGREDRLLLAILSEEMHPVLTKDQFAAVEEEYLEIIPVLKEREGSLAKKKEAIPEKTHQFEELAASVDLLAEKQFFLEDAMRRAKAKREQLRLDELGALLSREEEMQCLITDIKEQFRVLEDKILTEFAPDMARESFTEFPENEAVLNERINDLARAVSRAEALLQVPSGTDEKDSADIRPEENTPEPLAVLARMRQMLEEGRIRMGGIRSLLYLLDVEEKPAEDMGRDGEEDLPEWETNGSFSAFSGRTPEKAAVLRERDPAVRRKLTSYLAGIRDTASDREICDTADTLIRQLEEGVSVPDGDSFGTDSRKEPFFTRFTEEPLPPGSFTEEPEAVPAMESFQGKEDAAPESVQDDEPSFLPDVPPAGECPEGVEILLSVSVEEYREAMNLLKGMPDSADYTEAAEVFRILRPLVARQAMDPEGGLSKALAVYTEGLLEEVKGMEEKSYLNDNVRRKQFARRAAKAYKKYRELLLSDPVPETGEEESGDPASLGRSFLELMMRLMVLPEAGRFTEDEIKEQVAEWIG